MNDKNPENKYVMVAHNHVAIKPPPFLYPALVKLFEGTMVHPVSEAMFHATIFYSKEPLITFSPDPTKEFKVGLLTSKIWFDSYTGNTNLIIRLASEDMIKRNEEIQTKHNGISVYPKYEPHCTIVYDIAMTRTRKAILNAFTDYVSEYLAGETMIFTGEYLESTSGMAQALNPGHSHN